MSMQEIEEDLETFCKINHKRPINRTQVVDDLVEKRKTEDLKTLSLHEWWDGFEVNKMQMKDLEDTMKNLNILKNSLKEEAKEVEERKSALLNEIEENLSRIISMKSPDE